MKNYIIGFALTSAMFACSVPASHNTFDGAAENYACTTSTGQIELKLISAALPDCVKLSELPPEEAKLITDAVNNPTPPVTNQGTIAIDTSKL